MIDFGKLKDLAGRLSVPVATATFPDAGEPAIKAVLAACREIFTQLDPSQLQESVVVFAQAATDAKLHLPPGAPVNHPIGLTRYAASGFFLQIDPSSKIMQISPGLPPLEINILRRSGVVFIHENGNERFLISDREITLPRLFPGEQSFFATPHYQELNDALEYYHSALVRQSSCDILKRNWFDSNRLYLKAKPEDAIQQSLLRFLRFSLRSDAEVMREQKVNDTDPVDIRVTFHFANRVALLEVKWLGKSRRENGDLATEYTQVRALDGAAQLADYLDSLALSSPGSAALGYLIVLDARRRALDPEMETISESDGMFYATQNIQFPTEYTRRVDIACPLRMFAEPVVG